MRSLWPARTTLAEGIRFQVLHANNFTVDALETSRDAKEALLLELQADIAVLVGPIPHAISDEQVEQCYGLFCAAARNYQAQYPRSPDMRMIGMDSVRRSNLVHAQTLEHLRARDSMFDPNENFEPLAIGALSSYKELICTAVEQLVSVQFTR